MIQDEYFCTRSQSDKNHITEKILEDVKGRMMEDIVLLETSKAAPRGIEVFKFKFDDGGEYDIVVYNGQNNTCRLYEVKHGKSVSERQTVYLRDEARLALASHLFGDVEGRYVIYRGKTRTVGDIQYVNAEEYLNALGEENGRN